MPSPRLHPMPRRVLRALVASTVAVAVACGGDGVTGLSDPFDVGDDGPSPDSPSQVSTALVGEWHLGTSGATNYFNSSTGSWSNPSGTGNTWRFAADGHFTHATLLQQSFYGCTTRVFWYDTGTYTASGTQVTLKSTHATMKSEDNCNAQWNYEKTVAGASGTMAFEIDGGSGTPTLTLHFSDGPMSFRRQ